MLIFHQEPTIRSPSIDFTIESFSDTVPRHFGACAHHVNAPPLGLLASCPGLPSRICLAAHRLLVEFSPQVSLQNAAATVYSIDLGGGDVLLHSYPRGYDTMRISETLYRAKTRIDAIPRKQDTVCVETHRLDGTVVDQPDVLNSSKPTHAAVTKRDLHQSLGPKWTTAWVLSTQDTCCDNPNSPTG